MQKVKVIDGYIDENSYNYLMELKKFFKDKKIKLIKEKDRHVYELKSMNPNNTGKLHFDTSRNNKYNFNNIKLQLRYESAPFIRLDLDSPPHKNEDGTISDRDHIHFIYNNKKHTYNLSQIKEIIVEDNKNFTNVFYSFCKYVKISIEYNDIQGVL